MNNDSVDNIICSLGGVKFAADFFQVTTAYIYRCIKNNYLSSKMLLQLHCHFQGSPMIELKINEHNHKYMFTHMLVS